VNQNPLRPTIERVLHELRPEADLVSLSSSEDFRDALDLDSLDFLNFVIGVHEATGVDIPERDYREVRTLADCLTYLEMRLGPHRNS
jgi:acyl carrier protein